MKKVWLSLLVFSLSSFAFDAWGQSSTDLTFDQMPNLRPIAPGTNLVKANKNNSKPLNIQQRNFDLPKPSQSANFATTIETDSLSETLQNQPKQEVSGVDLKEGAETWVGKLAKTAPEKISEIKSSVTSESDEGLLELVEGAKRTTGRSNASVFDISGVMLRMSLAQAEKAMMVRGFKLISQKMEIPNFIKWRNEEKCRGNGVVGYERLANCVVQYAKKQNHQYVVSAVFSKFSTKEEIEIKLTSNFTGNKIYKITYKSMSGKVTGSGLKAAYLRNIKVYDFWKKVNQKYGSPDDKTNVIWSLGMNKPYLKASTGFLLLEDPMLRELDYTRMSREDQRFMNTDLYSF